MFHKEKIKILCKDWGDSKDWVITLEKGKNIVGQIACRKDRNSSDGFIYGLFVIKEYRGQGYGANLLDMAEKTLRDNGCASCSLQAEYASWMFYMYAHKKYRMDFTQFVTLRKQL